MATPAKKTVAKTKAKAKPKQEVADIVETKDQLPAEMSDFLDESMGNADADSFAIPFLRILQSNSPECDPDDPGYLEGAKKGSILDTVTQEMFDRIEVFPVLFKREFVEWVLRNQGGGLAGRHAPEAIPAYTDTEVDGKMMLLMDNGHQLVDTRQHYVMFKSGENGYWKPAMIGMSSSQIKISKRLMAMVQDQRRARKLMTFEFSTLGQKNEKGSWSGWAAKPLNDASADPELLPEAILFQKAVKQGDVKVQGEDDGDVNPSASNNTFDD